MGCKAEGLGEGPAPSRPFPGDPGGGDGLKTSDPCARVLRPVRSEASSSSREKLSQVPHGNHSS